ncbi:MAG: DNA mismatch repair protein MutS [Tuberibacillus sp.]
MAYTPMIQQYLAIKKEYQDAFLFFRLGDFYEMFFEDAIKASNELEITLTSRDGGAEEKIPMCGVPYHAANGYIARLVEKGYKVAICEQMEDPRQAKGVVKREVIKLITPGTVMEEDALQPKENNYIGAIAALEDGAFGLAFLDLSTGESRATAVADMGDVLQEMTAHGCREVIVETSLSSSLIERITRDHPVTLSYEEKTEVPEQLEPIAEGLTEAGARAAIGKLFHYLLKSRYQSLTHLQPTEAYVLRDYMVLNSGTRRNLELLHTLRSEKKRGSLLWVIDKTMTAMGGRKLKQWLEKPLVDKNKIEKRLNSVEALIKGYFERQALRDAFSQVYDLERLVGRVSFGNVNARELLQLKRSLEQVPEIIRTLKSIEDDAIQAFAEEMDPCSDVCELINRSIVEDPPISVKEGGMIRDGYNKQLDEYRYVAKNGKAWIAELEQKERELTGIKSLKVGYNKVFGYYIEVTRANLRLLPEGRYERKQTLANAERFITPELKEKEKLILEAEDKMIDLEYDLFQGIRETIKGEGKRLQKLAKVIATLDVLQSFATVSDENNYTRPVFTENRSIKIAGGRHPVVERVMKDHLFVANDVFMDENCHILLITGPNMGGKSTFMRQTALTAIMAQIGCFVPCEKAELPIFDQIFTRIGAADDLVSGQSTFMVEMSEAEEALRNATDRSLILLDEIGRGTSTYDGIAIARAMIEFIHNKIEAKTLFSTHYHELTDLSATLKFLKNVHVGAMEEDGKVVFLHKVMEGQADKSYGIHVAKLAGLPDELIDRATVILADLEKQEGSTVRSGNAEATEDIQSKQLSFFAASPEQSGETNKKEKDILKRLRTLDLLSMTPMEAMNILFDIHQQLKK